MDLLSDPTSWASNVGFPMAIAGYLLVKMEKTMGEMRDEVRNLAAAIGTCPLKKPPTLS